MERGVGLHVRGARPIDGCGRRTRDLHPRRAPLGCAGHQPAARALQLSRRPDCVSGEASEIGAVEVAEHSAWRLCWIQRGCRGGTKGPALKTNKGVRTFRTPLVE